MKVAQVVCVWPPYGGGMGRVAFEYAKVLAIEHNVTVFTPLYASSQKFEQIEGVKIESLSPTIKYGNSAWLPQLPELLKNFDIIHLHYPFFGVHENLVPTSSQKLIVTYHMVPKPSGLAGIWALVDSYMTEKKLLKQTHTWFATSDDYCKTYIRPRLGANANIKILSLGVHDKFKVVPVSSGTSEFNLLPNVPVILFVGGLDKAHYFKGLEVLLKAVAGLSHPNWQLLVVGEGNLKSHYQLKADELSIGSKVIFAGRLTDESLIQAYNLASLLVLPSLNETEAFGLVLLEAMACGLPVVASNLPGVRSLVKAGSNGILVNPGDQTKLTEAIDYILMRPELAKKFGDEGKKIVEENYRWSKIGDELLDFYRSL